MKREYNRPTIEKIAFDYRNQVVAASSGEVQPSNNSSASNPYGIPDEIWSWAQNLGIDKLLDLINKYV